MDNVTVWKRWDSDPNLVKFQYPDPNLMSLNSQNGFECFFSYALVIFNIIWFFFCFLEPRCLTSWWSWIPSWLLWIRTIPGYYRDIRWVFWWTISWRPVLQYFPCPDPPEIQGGVFVDHLLQAGLRCIWILSNFSWSGSWI